MAANARTGRAENTRARILTAAERLFAEHGVFAVSNRQISEAAGQGNNAAVGYHFGTKVDLIRAIMRTHGARVEHMRQARLAEIDGSDRLRDWVSCLVGPAMLYHADRGEPTWDARFTAQVMTDPTLRDVVLEEALTVPSLALTLQGLNRCLPSLPEEVRLARSDMAQQLIVHTGAEQERAMASGTARLSWREAATCLVDALTGLWLAPVTDPPKPARTQQKEDRP